MRVAHETVEDGAHDVPPKAELGKQIKFNSKPSFAKRNFARQGKASAKPEGVVTYVEGDKSML